jgi:4-hydroxy-2-oxoheptanedioate aldolase
MLLIETAEAVENIDAILAVEGVDVIIPAQFDLSTNLGLQGRFDHPDFIAALERIERAADAAGIPRGAVALNGAQAAAAFARGCRLIAGFDILWLRGIAAEAQGWCR